MQSRKNKKQLRTIPEVKRAITRIITSRLGDHEYRVFFFGSRVTGRARERSDIDVGIEGPTEIPTRVFADIKEQIDNLPTLYTVDVVDFRRVSSGFRRIAKERVESVS